MEVADTYGVAMRGTGFSRVVGQRWSGGEVRIRDLAEEAMATAHH